MENENLSSPPERPNYWAVLPASVRYDERLPASAKILYAELSSLTESYGYSWAANDYFERLYGITERTVIRLLGKLEEAGYIRVEGGGTTKRRIWAGINPLAGSSGPTRASAPAKGTRGTDKNVSGTDKNVSAIYNRKEKQERETDSPKAPQGGRRVKQCAEWEPEMFERFWNSYPRHEDKAGARREWDRLKPDRELMRAMSAVLKRAKSSDEWRRGIGIPYACRWLSHRRWEDGEALALASSDEDDDRIDAMRREADRQWTTL